METPSGLPFIPPQASAGAVAIDQIILAITVTATMATSGVSERLGASGGWGGGVLAFAEDFLPISSFGCRSFPFYRSRRFRLKFE